MSPSVEVRGDRQILAVDIGTTSIKAACVTANGKIVSRSIHRVGNPGAARWREACALASGEAVSAADSRGAGPPEAMIFSGNGPSVVAVDAGGREVCDTLLWYDDRVVEKIPDCPSFFLPRIAWLFRNDPRCADRIRWFLSCPEYLVYLVTGQATTVRPHDAFTPYIWDESQAVRYGVDATKLPPFVYTGDLIGYVDDEHAREWGIPAGIPVVAGAYDFLMSLVGTDTLRAGRTCDRAGTSEGINHCAEHRSTDRRLRSLPHFVEELHNVAGVLSSTGRLFEWYRRISGQRGTSYEKMMSDILSTPAGVEPWFFPSLHQGADWEFSSGMFIGLGAEHGPAEMGRAVVESIGYAVREAVETIESAGFEVAELRACGGQSKNDLWNQMKANMVGKPVAIMEVPDAEIVGNAAAGLRALGVYGSVEEAAGELVRVRRRFEPAPETESMYAELFPLYLENYERFRAAFNARSPVGGRGL